MEDQKCITDMTDEERALAWNKYVKSLSNPCHIIHKLLKPVFPDPTHPDFKKESKL